MSCANGSVADGAGLALATPGGEHRLHLDGDCLVSDCGERYERQSGVWPLLDSSRSVEVEEFTTAYARVRSAEGRGDPSSEYYRALPHQDLSGKLAAQWSQRADSYDRFEAALAQTHSPGILVDVGAGNCWLAALMTAGGWTTLAVDINVDPHDGLQAAHHHGRDFCIAQATMEAQPLEDESVDVVVFNASIHYSRDVKEAIVEALRVLRPKGTVVVMDSPVYNQDDSGHRMVAEAAARFESDLGVPAAPLAGQGFVTDRQLADIANDLGLEWRDVGPDSRGVLRALKRRVATMRAGRELARRPILFGVKP